MEKLLKALLKNLRDAKRSLSQNDLDSSLEYIDRDILLLEKMIETAGWVVPFEPQDIKFTIKKGKKD